MTIHHEFTHSIDISRETWNLKEAKKRLSDNGYYKSVEREEPYFTDYADEKLRESFAEHGDILIGC